mgnify:FL=1
MAKILIFHTNPSAAQKLCDSLKKEKYDAVLCGEQHTVLSDTESASLVILDGQMKWTLCRPLLEAFAHRSCPVLFLTNDREMSAHLRALYSGQCDVLVCPHSSRQLHGKVRALLGEDETPGGDLKLDMDDRVALIDGRRVELTAQEFALLYALMENPDVPISREQLLRTAWGYQSMGETRTVDVHVQRLRKKLGCERIETVYKCGYRLKMA